MDYASLIILFLTGFAIGLLGAMMPGPLLIYTVNESLHRGKWTGALVILGHALVEIVIFVLLALGLLSFLNNLWFQKWIYIIGGLAMILMAFHSARSINERIKQGIKKSKRGLVAGGIFFTAFNPGFPIWWATAGMSMLLEGLRLMGYLGMITILIGHWVADLAWFLFVSMTTSKTSGLIYEKNWYRSIRAILSVALLAIGLYFLKTGLQL